MKGTPRNCKRCGRLSKALKTERAPDGRLHFDWCEECRYELHRQALGIQGEESPELPPPSSKAFAKEVKKREQEEIWSVVDPARALGLRLLALIFGIWALLLEGMVVVRQMFPAKESSGAARAGTLPTAWFLVGGFGLAVTAAGLWVVTLEPKRRRHGFCVLLEAVGLAVGFGTLLLAIAYHDPRRNVLVIGIVAISGIIAVFARLDRRKNEGPRFRTRSVRT